MANERRPLFGPQSHHSPEERRVAELLAARERAYAANDETWGRNYTSQINEARRALKKKETTHPAIRDGSAKRG